MLLSALAYLGDRTVKITLDGGVTFYNLGLPKDLAGQPVTKIWDVDISGSFTDLNNNTYRYIGIVGQNGTTAGSAAFYYRAFGAYTSEPWRNAVVDAPIAGYHYASGGTDTAFVAVKFSPAFAQDNIVYLLSSNGSTSTTAPAYVKLHVCSLNIVGRFNTGITGFGYYNDSGISLFSTVGYVAKAQILFDAQYCAVFYDAYYRLCYYSCAGYTSGGGAKSLTEDVNGVPNTSTTYSAIAAWSCALNGSTFVFGDAYDTAVGPYGTVQMKRVGGGAETFGGIDDAASQLTVFYAGDNLLCAKQGLQASFLLSEDNGKTFNGISLVNTQMTFIDDFAVEPAAGIEQYIVSHGCTMTNGVAQSDNASSVWYYDGTYWERVFIRANIASPASTDLIHRYQIKASPQTFGVVYLADTDNATIYYTSDNGKLKWMPRIAPLTGTLIADIEVVDDANLYVATNVNTNGYVCPLTFSGLYWHASDYITVFGSNIKIFSINLASADEVVAGSATGGKVAYTTTGGKTPAAWSVIPGFVGGLTPGNDVIAEAQSPLSVVYATSTQAGHAEVDMYVLGSSAAAWTYVVGSCIDEEGGIYSIDLLIYGTGIGKALYYLSGYGSGSTAVIGLYRTLFDLPAGGWCGICDCTTWGGMTPDAMKGSVPNNTIWFTDMYGSNIWPSPMRGFGETMGVRPQIEYVLDSAAYLIPTITGPANGYIVQVNKETGIGYDVTLTWTGGPAYVEISKSADFLDLKAWGCRASPCNAGPHVAGTLASNTLYVDWQPGEIFYWRIRFACGGFCTHYSEVRTLNIQPTPIPIPELYAPACGGVVTTLTPGFTWSPMSGTASASGITTTYTIQVGTGPDLNNPAYLLGSWQVTGTTGFEMPVDFLIDGSTYYWRVSSTVVPPGDWSPTCYFTVNLPTEPPTTTVTSYTAPATQTVPVPTNANQTTVSQTSPAYIWAVIIIGAVLVVAIIVLIFRTRRS